MAGLHQAIHALDTPQKWLVIYMDGEKIAVDKKQTDHQMYPQHVYYITNLACQCLLPSFHMNIDQNQPLSMQGSCLRFVYAGSFFRWNVLFQLAVKWFLSNLKSFHKKVFHMLHLHLLVLLVTRLNSNIFIGCKASNNMKGSVQQHCWHMLCGELWHPKYTNLSCSLHSIGVVESNSCVKITLVQISTLLVG